MKSIAVIGQGFVGGSLTTVFAERGFNVYVYDKARKVAKGGKIPSRIMDPDFVPPRTFGETPVESVKDLVKACEFSGKREDGWSNGEGVKTFSGVYFVCLPTPMFEDGEADLTIVEGVLTELAEANPGKTRIAVVKSTVPPGSVERWNHRYNPQGLFIVFNPEFLTEANALDDMRNQDRIILGGPRPHINTVKLVFQTAFPKVPIIKTSSTTAEMVKYTINCFLSTKVAFANEMAQLCEALDDKGLNIDYDKVVEYAKLDKRLGNSHWSVPGPVPTHDGRYVRGFGGHCFPKDLNALVFVAEQLGVDMKVLKGAWAKNLEVRPPEDRDWERMQGRAVSKKKPQ
jgi:UDPglucose 6-dehydrogenase